MSDVPIGQSVSKAYAFLETFATDLAALSNTITQLMSAVGWEDWYPLKVPPRKFDTDCFGLYAPAAPKGVSTFRYAVMVQVHLPSTTFSAEPLLLALVADFGRPASDSAVWNAWDREGGVGAMRYLHEQGGHGQLPLSILSDKLAPAATRAEGIVLPVCGLHSADHVRDYVVEPILQIARRFECGVAVARAPGASALMP